MWSRKELKSRAWEMLKTSYWKAFLVSIVITIAGGNGGSSFSFNTSMGRNNISLISPEAHALIVFAIIAAIFAIMLVFAFRIFLGFALEVGGKRYFVQSAQKNVDLNALGFSFEKGRYLDILKAMLWRMFINFLWALLLIIPGIVKAYAFRMVPYILSDSPNIGYKRALDLSEKMTAGHKISMFILDLSFIGWFILGFLAFIIGAIFVLPYYNATFAELYLVLRQSALDRQLCTNEELLLS